MKDTDTDYRHEVALFRYDLIADLVHRPPGTKGLYRRLEEKAAKPYLIPGTHRTRVAPETLRDWLKLYRKGGFKALMPKPRTDRGQSRTLPAPVVERRLCIKEANPKLAVKLAIQAARSGTEVPNELPLFEQPAVEALFQATQGRPRKVNRLPITPSPAPPSTTPKASVSSISKPLARRSHHEHTDFTFYQPRHKPDRLPDPIPRSALSALHTPYP
jgi:hypothetical protein